MDSIYRNMESRAQKNLGLLGGDVGFMDVVIFLLLFSCCNVNERWVIYEPL